MLTRIVASLLILIVGVRNILTANVGEVRIFLSLKSGAMIAGCATGMGMVAMAGLEPATPAL
jgi:hypothetical protein